MGKTQKKTTYMTSGGNMNITLFKKITILSLTLVVGASIVFWLSSDVSSQTREARETSKSGKENFNFNWTPEFRPLASDEQLKIIIPEVSKNRNWTIAVQPTKDGESEEIAIATIEWQEVNAKQHKLFVPKSITNNINTLLLENDGAIKFADNFSESADMIVLIKTSPKKSIDFLSDGEVISTKKTKNGFTIQDGKVSDTSDTGVKSLIMNIVKMKNANPTLIKTGGNR